MVVNKKQSTFYKKFTFSNKFFEKHIHINMSKKFDFYRNFSTAKIEIAEHFSELKWWYICIAVFSVLGIIIGVVTGFAIAPDATTSQIPDSIFLNYIEGNVSIFGVFFSRIFGILAVFGLVFLANCKPFLCVFNIIILIYRGFIVGATTSLLIVLFNVGGIINVIFIVIPCHLVLLLMMISWSAICMSYNFNTKTYGGCVISRDFFCNHKGAIFCICAISFVAILIEALLLPWLTAAIIIGD